MSISGYPTRQADGYWTPPALAPDKFAANVEIDEAEAQKPLFEGSVNGFRFFGQGDPLKQYPCDPAEARLISPKEFDVPLQVGYFPPGTIEQAPRIQLCPDGALQLVVRSFEVGSTAFSVSYHAGELAIHNDSIREGRIVKDTTMNGAAAVVVEPINDDGYGESLIAWQTKSGFIRVYAIDIPLDEVTKIAASVGCLTC